MDNWTWEDLRKYWIGSELWLENEPAHWAVLTARAMHAKRIIANEEAAPVDSFVDPAPVDPTPAVTKEGK